MANRIDEYKALLGYGARGNLFQITFTPPTAAGVAFKTASVIIHKTGFPKPRDIEKATIDYDGQKFNIANTRGEYEDLTIEWKQREAFDLYDDIRGWMDFVHNGRSDSEVGGADYNIRTSPADHKGVVQIDMLGKDLSVIKTAICEGIFPLTLTAYDLDMGTPDILSNTATFAIDSVHYK